MAVYTDITEDEVRTYIAQYDIGDVLSYKGIAEGVENSNFLLHTTQGQFILTLYEKRVNADDLPFFLGLMDHLSRHGISCPLPVTMRNGRQLGALAGRPAAIITFLEGMWPRRADAHHCEAVGRALARMHQATTSFDMNRANGLGPAEWRPLWTDCLKGDEPLDASWKVDIEATLAVTDTQWPAGLPEGVIHADMFPDNVFFLDGDLSGIIDYYFACTDFLAYDLAICLNAWCFERDHAFNLTKGAAMLRGYQSVRPLEKAELDALPILARGASVRFLLTRLFDWVNTPEGSMVVKKDPTEYIRKMQFHARTTDAADYGA